MKMLFFSVLASLILEYLQYLMTIYMVTIYFCIFSQHVTKLGLSCSSVLLKSEDLIHI